MLPGKKLTPADILAMLKRRAWLLAGPALLGLFVGLIISSQQRNTYQAEMLLQIVPQRVPDAYVRSTVTMNTEDRLESLQAQVKSRTMLEQVIRDLKLYPEKTQRLPMEDVIESMRLDVAIDLVRPNRLAPPDAFYVRYKYSDPELTARVARRLGSLFVDQNARERGALADSTSKFMERQLEEAKDKLEAHDKSMEAFRQAHAGRLPTQLDSNMQNIQTLNMQLQAQVTSLAGDRNQKMMLERLYNEAVAEPPVVSVIPGTVTGAPGSAGTPGAPGATLSARQQLEMAKSNLAMLESRYRPDWPDIPRVKRQIAELTVKAAAEAEEEARERAARAKEGGSSTSLPPAVTVEQQARRERLANQRAEIEALDRKIKFQDDQAENLRRQIADYQGRIASIPGIESEWIALSRDYETLQANYRNLLTKSEESKVAANLERQQIGEGFRVLDDARVPTKPIGPFRLQINGIALAVGLLIGLLVSAFLELRDTTFRTERDVFDVLALPVLALVPLVKSEAEVQRQRRWHLLTSGAVAVVVLAGGYVFWAMQLWKHVV